jgi:hypothetical protein
MGVQADLNLATEDFTDRDFWRELVEENLITDAVAYAALNTIGTITGNAGAAGASASIFGIIGRNEVRSSVAARLTNAPVLAAASVTVSATEDATLSATDASTVESWNSKGGVIVTNVVLAGATASITGGDVTTSGDLKVLATNTSTLTATATTTIAAFDVSLGLVIAFNSIGWKGQNLLFNFVDALLGAPTLAAVFDGSEPSSAIALVRDANLNVGGAVEVIATQAAVLKATTGNEGFADAALDAVLAAGWATSGLSGGAIVATNKVNTAARASVEHTGTTRGKVTAGGAVTISAADSASIESHSTIVQRAIVSNTAAGLAAFVGKLAANDYRYTTKSGSQLIRKHDRVLVGSDHTAGGVTGGTYEYIGADRTTPLDLGAEDFRVLARWKKIDRTGGADDLANLYPNLGNLTKSNARALGFLVLMNDVRAAADASLKLVDVTAEALTVRATETAQLLSEATSTVEASGGSFRGTGTVQAINGQLVTNLVLASVTASVANADVVARTGDVTVEADNRAGIDATLMAATASGDLAVSFAIAFNSLGWASQNVLFNLVDTILGVPVLSLEQPAAARATVTDATITSGGALTVNADNAAQLNATVSNAASSTAGALWKAEGKSVGGIIASNKVSSAASAKLERTNAQATGAATVSAADAAGISSNVKLVSSSITTNNGGTAVLQDEINLFLQADHATSEGTKTVKFGDRVRISDTPSLPAGTVKGQIYTYMGTTSSFDLAAADYADRGYWRPVKETNLVPQGLNFTESKSVAFGGAVVLNDARSDVEATITGSTVKASQLAITATESATIEATNDLFASSAGGSSFTGQGTSLAINAVIATNRVLSAARASASSSALTTTAGLIAVDATNTSQITATTLSAVTTGANAAGIVLAFNTVGWKAGDIFTATLDVLIGTPVAGKAAWGGEQPSTATALAQEHHDRQRGRRARQRDLHGEDRRLHLQQRDVRPGGPLRRRRDHRVGGGRVEQGLQRRERVDRGHHRQRRRRRRDRPGGRRRRHLGRDDHVRKRAAGQRRRRGDPEHLRQGGQGGVPLHDALGRADGPVRRPRPRP